MHLYGFNGSRSGRFWQNSSEKRARAAIRAAAEPLEPRRLFSFLVNVNTNADTLDYGSDVTVDGLGSTVSLRDAITAADNSGATTIDFTNLPAGDNVINLTDGALPAVTVPVIIEGGTFAGFSSGTRVQINGRDTEDLTGLVLTGGNSVINDLDFEGCNESIDLTGGGSTGLGSDLITGNFINVSDDTEQSAGILIENGSSDNTIGGGSAADRNIIDAFEGNGIEIDGGTNPDANTASAGSNVIQGNFFGTDPTGMNLAESQPNDAIYLVDSANNTIGGSGGFTSPTANVMDASTTNIETDDDTTDDNGNGVVFRNQFEGNLICVNASATAVLSSGSGISVENYGNSAAYGNSVSGNLIAGSSADAITLFGPYNTVTGNTLGQLPSGQIVGNSVGVYVNAIGNLSDTIGGSAAGDANTIAYVADQTGIQIVQGDGVTISQNAIFSDGSPSSDEPSYGIELSEGTIVTNPPSGGDPRGGPNGPIEYPVITSVTNTGNGTQLTVTGTYSGNALTDYVIELFANDPDQDYYAPDAFGPGQLFITSFEVFTNASGQATINTNIPLAGNAGQFISATATDTSAYNATSNPNAGATSEFSPDVQAPAGTGTPNQLAFSSQPVNTTTAGTLAPVVVDVENSSGALASDDDSTVTLTLNSDSSTGTLGGTTSVAAVDGVATFSNLTVSAPGAYMLIASDGDDTTTTSSSFTVFPPPEMVGGLNLSFGVNGLASHDVGFAGTYATAQDGTQSVIVGAIGSAPNESFGVTRFNADGSLDTTFGTGGVASPTFPATSDAPAAVYVLPGGQILVVGTATTYTNGVASGSEFAIAEYNPNGTKDTSFGAGAGHTLISFSSTPGTLTDDVLGAIEVSDTGVIYLGGSSSAGGSGGTQFAIAALSAAGALETSFGSGGKVLLDFAAGGDDVINALALQKNGDLVAAGSATSGSVTEVAVARFLPTGVPDKHFGADGKVTTSVRGVYDSASSVVIQTNGAIVIGGASATGSGATLSSDFLLARYTSSGHLDKSFAGGTVITSFGQPSAVTQLVLESDGDIIASGKTTPSLTSVVGNELEVAIARYTDRGALDTTFNGTGKTIINLSGDPGGASDTQVAAEILIGPLDTSSLGTQFDQFVGSEQGVVSMTPGGDILDAGNSGASTVEAEIITAGVDLAASLLTRPPASVTGGSKGSAKVGVAEDGTLIAAGIITIDLEVCSNSQASGGTIVTTLPERISLKRLQSRTYKVSFDYPRNLAAGDYYVAAVLNTGPSPALQNLNPENGTATSTSAVDIAPPFISLAASALSATSKFDPGKPVAVTFTVMNNGNVTAKGTTTVELLLSTDQTPADGTTVDTAKLPVNQPAAKTKVYHVSFKLPTTVTAGTDYLIAVLDPTDDLGSIDHTSSTAVDATQVTVG